MRSLSVLGLAHSSFCECATILYWPEEFLLKYQLLILTGIQLYVIYVFPFAALNVCFLCLNFQCLIKMCFEVFHFVCILFGTLWCVGIQGAISFPI